MNKNFTKKDLKNLMVVEQRNGWRGVVVDDHIYSWDSKGNDLYTYNDDLTDTAKCLFGLHIFDADEVYDIVKVYEAKGKFFPGRATMEEIADFLQTGNTSNFELIWERKEKKDIKLTTEERAFLNSILLVSDYKYIARDSKYSTFGNALWVYKEKPIRDGYRWYPKRLDITIPDTHTEITKTTKGMFEFITWDDDEPYLIEDLLKGDIK